MFGFFYFNTFPYYPKLTNLYLYLEIFKLKMKKYYCLFFILLLTISCYTQPPIESVLKKYNTESIPYITVDSLTKRNNIFLLDTREKAEYDVSHIKNALYVGYNFFNIETVTNKIKNKKSEIIVYCSIGLRSEDIGERLKKAGYTNVTNLYGGIFEWKKKNNPVYDSKNKETNKVHAYSKFWGKLLTNAQKIY